MNWWNKENFDNEDGKWSGGTGPNFDPNKRYGKPIALKQILEEFLKNIDNMEEFLMKEAYLSIIEDKHFLLYPRNEVEHLAIQDLINYFTDLEEYEKCAQIVKYLEEGEINSLLSKKNNQ